MFLQKTVNIDTSKIYTKIIVKGSEQRNLRPLTLPMYRNLVSEFLSINDREHHLLPIDGNDTHLECLRYGKAILHFSSPKLQEATEAV